MAEERNDSLTKNKAFLQQQERLRMNKPSSLAIDLRNKVNGECQAYEFGGVTHYLDDRGYLLAKRLMERSGGRYTIGVYELVIKAIKTLSQAQSNLPPVKTTQGILSRDSRTVQLLHFDKLFERENLRILYTTQLEIHLNDLTYHATTIDISNSAIRTVMKRAYTLNKNDIILISFIDLKSASDPSLLLKIPYKIIKIEHDELRTHIILMRVDDRSDLTDWFTNWAAQHQSLSQLDVEHKLLNTVQEFYLRLYHQTSKKPLIWLSDINAPDPVKAIHINPESEKTLRHLIDAKGQLDVSLLPIQQAILEQSDYLVFISIKNDIASSVVIAGEDRTHLAQALSQPFEQVLLLQNHSLSFSEDDFKQDFNDLFELNEAQAKSLQLRLASVNHLITLSDISLSCRQLPLAPNLTSDLSMLITKPVLSARLPKPEPLHHHIDRKEQRFLIHTDISLYVMDEHLTISTSDVSETGILLELSGHFPVSEKTILRINFIRWQNKAKKVTMNNVPFIVRSIQYWEGTTTLGLERNIRACGKKINQFFAETIEENRTHLALDNRDRFVIQESKLFGHQLTHAMPNLPFFLGLNTDKNRVIQAIANTDANQAAASATLWEAVSALATEMSELVRMTPDNVTSITDFGLYCYQDKSAQWQIKTDLDFLTSEQKSVFIHRALLHNNYRFFHCDLTGIKNVSIDQERDLSQQLSSLHRHTAHHLRRTKELTQSLFAVGDLTDITVIIETAYPV